MGQASLRSWCIQSKVDMAAVQSAHSCWDNQVCVRVCVCVCWSSLKVVTKAKQKLSSSGSFQVFELEVPSFPQKQSRAVTTTTRERGRRRGSKDRSTMAMHVPQVWPRL